MQAQEIRPIKMRENAVFRVVSTAGRSFAMRIHHDGNHSDAALRSELQWMAALQKEGFELPRVVPSVDGRLFVRSRVDSSASFRQVDMFEWIEGRQLGTSDNGLASGLGDTERTYRTIGSLMARLHNQAVAWSMPTGFERQRWDVTGLVGEQPLWGRFWELAALSEPQRELLMRARDRVRRELESMSHSADAAQCFSLIHADFVPENLLISSEGQVRLLDFDDAGFGWHLFDIATALYFIQDDPLYAAAQAGLIAGYRNHRDLASSQLEKLPVFMAARGFSYLGWVHTRPASKAGQEITPHLIRLACRQAERLLPAGPPG
jgi:Ser/Thr protein kinase RdoA (MazF antagonist)